MTFWMEFQKFIHFWDELVVPTQQIQFMSEVSWFLPDIEEQQLLFVHFHVFFTWLKVPWQHTVYHLLAVSTLNQDYGRKVNTQSSKKS